MAENAGIVNSITLAIRNGSLEAVKGLLNNLNERYSHAFCRMFLGLCRIALDYEHIEIAKLLLQKYIKANSWNEWLYTAPLVVACDMNSVEIVNFLLGFEPHHPELLQYALLIACDHGSEEIVSTLLNAGAEPNEVLSVDEEVVCVYEEELMNYYDIHDFSPLILACQEGHAGVVNVLLNRGAEVNCFRSENNYRPLHIASEMGYEEIVGHLLKHNASLHVEANDKVTPLHLAAKTGALKVVKMLLCSGANVDARTSEGSSPLLLAVEFKHAYVALKLLEKGACINAKDQNGNSPLSLAVSTRNLFLVKFLLGRDPVIDDGTRKAVRRVIFEDYANNEIVDAFSEHDFTLNADDLNAALLMVAVKNRYSKIVEWLLSHGVNPTDPKFDSFLLHEAVESGHKEMIEPLIKSGCDVNGKNVIGNTPICGLLNISDRGLYAEMVQILIHYGAVVRQAPKLLFSAIEKGWVELCRILIENGANINCLNDETKTPLHVTLSTKTLFYHCQEDERKIGLSKPEGGEITKLLVQNNANLNVKTRSGHAPIHLAAMNGIEEAVCILLDHGANVNALDSNKNSPLHLAISRNFEDSNPGIFKRVGEKIVELLLSYGAEVNRKMANNRTSLHLAAECHLTQVTRMLLHHGADVNSRAGNGGLTPLDLACQNGNKETVKLLLDNGANVEACQWNGRRPLQLAALSGHADVIDVLLAFGAKMDARDTSNETALHWAAKNNHYAAVRSLLHYGCDVNIVNNGGETAFEIAVSEYQSWESGRLAMELNSNPKKLLAAFKEHIIKLDAAGFYVCENIRRLLNLDPELVYLQQKCEGEISRMKCETILDQYTLYGVFVKRRHPIHMRNKSLLNTLKTSAYHAYPIYKSLLLNTFKKCEERIKLLDYGSKSLKILLKTGNVLNPQQVPIPSAEMLEEVVSYLGNEDLKNLIRCGQNLMRQLNR